MFNLSVQTISKESTFMDILELQGRVQPLLAFCLVFSISVYIWVRLRKRPEKISGIKTINDIPSCHYLPSWMPSIIEILVMFYKIRTEGIGFTFDLWRSTNYSSIYTFKTPLLKTVAITDHELIKQVLGSPLTQFLHKPRYMYEVYITETLMDGLIGSHPNTWKPHRKILNQYFTHRMQRSHLKTINKYGNLILKDLEATSKDKIKVDEFAPVLHDNLLNIILEMVLGEEITNEMGTREISTNYQKAKTLAVYRILNPLNIIPFLRKFSPKGKEYLDAVSCMQNYLKEGIFKSRRALQNKQAIEGDGSEGNLSCMEHMLLNNFSEKEIMDEVSTLLVGGQDTTNSSLHCILQHLAEHPHIQAKCHDEIDLIFNSKEFNLDVTLDDLCELKYLERCILEALRLTPTTPAFFRQIIQKTQVGDYMFEKGTILCFQLWLVHRNPEIYPEPEKLDPDRFLPENVKARHPYAYMPFSMGPRNCIGWKFAMMEMKTIMALILRHYHVSTSDKLKDVKLNVDMTLLPKGRFSLALHKRKLLEDVVEK